jgi:WD40 repeat protein
MVFTGTLLAVQVRSSAQEPTILEPTETIQPNRNEPRRRPPVITAVAVAPGGAHLATAGDDHIVRIWSATDGRLIHKLQAHSDWVRAVAFLADGQTLISAGDDGRIVLWNASTGERQAELDKLPHVVYAIAISPDGSQLAAVGFHADVHLFDLKTMAATGKLDGPDSDLRAICFSPDGSRLAAAGRNGKVRIWSMAAGTIDLEIAAEGIGRLRALGWMPHGDKLVSAGENRQLSVWDATNGQLIKKVHCQTGKLMSMVVCGEDLIATGGSDNVIRVWNWQSETQADALVGHTGSVAALAFDSTSHTIISGSFDTTIRVWRLDQPGKSQETAEYQLDVRVR